MKNQLICVTIVVFSIVGLIYRRRDMPRLARLHSPGVLHNIMIRGIERHNIFGVKKDRKDFLVHITVKGTFHDEIQDHFR
jgi:hypothetical protein